MQKMILALVASLTILSAGAATAAPLSQAPASADVLGWGCNDGYGK